MPGAADGDRYGRLCDFFDNNGFTCCDGRRLAIRRYPKERKKAALERLITGMNVAYPLLTTKRKCRPRRELR